MKQEKRSENAIVIDGKQVAMRGWRLLSEELPLGSLL